MFEQVSRSTRSSFRLIKHRSARTSRAGASVAEASYQRNSSPTLTPWAQKFDVLNTGAGRAGPTKVPWPVEVGDWLAFTPKSVSLPGRATLLQYRNEYPTKKRNWLVSKQPTLRSSWGMTEKASRVLLPMLVGCANTPPGRMFVVPLVL